MLMMTMIMLMQAKLEKVAQAASEAAARLAEERAAKDAAVAQRKVVNANRLAGNKKVQADAEKQRLEVCLAICASAMCQLVLVGFGGLLLVCVHISSLIHISAPSAAAAAAALAAAMCVVCQGLSAKQRALESQQAKDAATAAKAERRKAKASRVGAQIAKTLEGNLPSNLKVKQLQQESELARKRALAERKAAAAAERVAHEHREKEAAIASVAVSRPSAAFALPASCLTSTRDKCRLAASRGTKRHSINSSCLRRRSSGENRA